jgi:hypothetical protein
MTPEEHQRRGDAADELFREIVRRAAKKGHSPVTSRSYACGLTFQNIANPLKTSASPRCAVCE